MPLCLAKVTDIEHGHVMASSASLTKLFAQKMKTSNQQSITGINLHTKGDHVVIRGTVHKRIGIPFEIEGRVDNVEGRAIRLHAEKIKAVGLPVKGLLNMLGVELGSLINPDSTAGVTDRRTRSYLTQNSWPTSAATSQNCKSWETGWWWILALPQRNLRRS